MTNKENRQEIEMEVLEAEISDLEERLSDESEDDTASTPKTKETKRFSFRKMASSVISKLSLLAPRATVTLHLFITPEASFEIKSRFAADIKSGGDSSPAAARKDHRDT